jgi:hypothetical protein
VPGALSCEVCSRPRERPAAASPAAATAPGDDWLVAEPPARPLWVWISAAAAAVVVLGVGGAVGIPRFLRSDPQATAAEVEQDAEAGPTPAEVGTEPTQPGITQPGTTEPDTTAYDTVEPGPSGTTTPPATTLAGSGLVTVAPGVSDSRSAAVAALLDTYFRGINDKDYAAVATTLDPAGTVDPNDRSQMAAFARGTRSTRDSDVSLNGLAGAPTGRLRAAVTFRSRQSAGDGPRRAPGETCTRWRVTYTITVTPDGTYRIRGSKGSSAPC